MSMCVAYLFTPVAYVPTLQTDHQHPQLHVISRFYFDSYRHVSCQSITTSPWTTMDNKNAEPTLFLPEITSR